MRAERPRAACLVAAVPAVLAVFAAISVGLGLSAHERPAAAGPATTKAMRNVPHMALVDDYCVTCHDAFEKKGGLALDEITADVSKQPEVWEKVVRKLRARQMPPVGRKERPDEATYDATIGYLETALDRTAALHPNPGRSATLRRLTRTEYQNAIRDLLALDIDAASLLPADESSYGFDNVTVGNLSPTLLDRYISAAEKISRVALGRPTRSPGGDTVRLQPDLTQEDHLEGLPIGTRGGAAIDYAFPMDGEYEIQIRLMRDRDEHIEGLTEPHDLELLLDRARVQVFTVKPPQREPEHATVDQHLKIRMPVKAGPHALGVAFLKKPSLLLETARRPYQARFNYYRHPRVQPAIYSISIIGPYGSSTPGDTPSRRRLFGSVPQASVGAAGNGGDTDDRAAKQILGTLMKRAYRRPVTAADLEAPFALYKKGRADGGLDAGLEAAVAAVLVSPHFLFRVEADPAGVPSNTPYRVTDLELASRLSFFLWSSVPDDELLNAAIAGTLHQPVVLDRQVRRMMADSRSRALVDNFASQWLHLRNLASITPDMRLFPDFDDNLRQAFRRETELFVDSVLRDDRSVLDLLHADYTFLNERLAKHYGIPHVYGSHFRRVALGENSERGGLLRHGSVLTVTSYATRTSPVVRGKWILDNLLGVPPPPPLPDVPALKDNTVDGNLTVRMRLAEHRKNPACASCHNVMDPIGLSLETYDAVGRRRTAEGGVAIDASGRLPDGSKFSDVDGLETALLRRPELFVGAFTEKLLTYASGRGVEYYDAPAVRTIVREARPQGYRMSSIVLGVVKSKPFQMRMSR